MMSSLTLNHCLGVTENVIPLSPLWVNYRVKRLAGVPKTGTTVSLKWGHFTTTIPSQNKIFSLARFNPLKKPLFAVVALNNITIGGGNNQNGVYQPLGSMPRFFNSFLANSLSQLAKLTLSFRASLSNCSRKSGDRRKLKAGDFPAPLGLLSLFIVDMYIPIGVVLNLLGVYISIMKPIKATSRSGGTLTRRLTNNVKRSYDMAIYKSTPTHPKYKYLFLAVRRADITAKPVRAEVTAYSEYEARLSLVAEYVLFFAGRLPVRGQA